MNDILRLPKTLVTRLRKVSASHGDVLNLITRTRPARSSARGAGRKSRSTRFAPSARNGLGKGWTGSMRRLRRGCGI